MYNFKDPDTGELIEIHAYKSKYANGMKYYDSQWNELLNSNGNPLVKIVPKGDIVATAIVCGDGVKA